MRSSILERNGPYSLVGSRFDIIQTIDSWFSFGRAPSCLLESTGFAGFDCGLAWIGGLSRMKAALREKHAI